VRTKSRQLEHAKHLRGEPPGDSVSPLHIPDFMRHVNPVFTNPILGPLARVMPPLAMICHVGQTSGRNYSTPAVAFRSSETFVIPITYGRDVDWARNVVSAHGCEIEQMGRRLTTSNPRVVDLATAGPELPAAIREAFRIADLPGYLLLDLQPD
jgi:hypothetical protein